MEHKHAIVIDAKGHKKEFVLVDIAQEDGQLVATPQFYEMQDGEQLVYDGVQDALAMYRARWTGSTWQEMATPEEIAAEEERRRGELGFGDTTPPPPDPRDLAIAELSMIMAETQMTVAETQMAVADISMLMGGVTDAN